MYIHKEGKGSIIVAAIIVVLINAITFFLTYETYPVVTLTVLIFTVALFLFIISFFRIPKREHTTGDSKIICPADGKVVVIEEITDVEYFNDRRIQVSIFMSPANVHVNRNPISGKVLYSKYHKGKYLVAWHPKSSTENERHSVVLENDKGVLLVKQIAGALAKRIVNYLKEGQEVNQCEELGFIKFGSRVDVLLPLDAKIDVQLNQVVKGGVTVLAHFND
jgi:phosphatidylserine decarboxylase